MEGPILKLIFEKGPRGGETLEFNPGSAIRVGRVVRGNNLQIKDSGISSKHLSIQLESGKWVVRDLDSSNGTLLNNAQLLPDKPADLRDFDSIKIGELTSITVRIIGCDESRLRRNPRRGGAGREGEMDAVGLVAENRGRKGASKLVRVLKEEENEAILASVSEVGFDNNVGVVAETRARRGRPKKAIVLENEAVEESGEVEERDRSLDYAVGSAAGNRGRKEASKMVRVLKEEENEAVLASVSEVGLGKKLDNNVGVVMENGGRRGRPKKAKVLKNEPVEESGEVQEGERSLDLGRESGKVGQVGVEPVSQIGSRRSRASKKEDYLVSSLILQKIPEISKLDYVEIGIEEKKTKMGLRRKRNTQDEPMETDAIDGSTDKEVVRGSNCEEKTYTESSSMQGATECSTEVGDGPDLEKMTLGDWFDNLELNLSKQIFDVTEEMIAGMRERGQQVGEYTLQQKKGKLSVC